jgi:hypothetical protein
MGVIREFKFVVLGACLGVPAGVFLMCLMPTFIVGGFSLTLPKDPELVRQVRVIQGAGFMSGIGVGVVAGLLLAIRPRSQRRARNGDRPRYDNLD